MCQFQVYSTTIQLKLTGFMRTYNTLENQHQKKDILFIIGDWNAKVGSQEIPRITGKCDPGVQKERGQGLTEFCQENMWVTTNTLFQQPKRWLYKWISPDGQCWNQIAHVLCSQRWRSSIQSIKTRSGTDCGSAHKLLTAKFRLKLKKVGKTNRPFRHDLNQITVEVMNRFKGLGLVGRVIEELRTGL